MLFPTTIVGSYPQPEWLIDRQQLTARLPPRVRARDLWRIPEPWLRQAQDDATLLAIRFQEEVGLDIVSDGEIRRESYSNRFATALEGVDLDNPAVMIGRAGLPNPVPRIVGRVKLGEHWVVVVGIDREQSRALADDRRPVIAEPGSVMVGAALARRLGLKPQSSILLEAARTTVLPVGGVFETGAGIGSANAIVMDLGDAQQAPVAR